MLHIVAIILLSPFEFLKSSFFINPESSQFKAFFLFYKSASESVKPSLNITLINWWTGRKSHGSFKSRPVGVISEYPCNILLIYVDQGANSEKKNQYWKPFKSFVIWSTLTSAFIELKTLTRQAGRGLLLVCIHNIKNEHFSRVSFHMQTKKKHIQSFFLSKKIIWRGHAKTMPSK